MPLISLWIVATPLGNLKDFSPRAKEVLSEVDFVLTEDTRRAGILCKNSEVEVKRFISFHEHNELHKIEKVLEQLKEGKTCAIISDAGMPLMADPGYRLVCACKEHGYKVSVVPGACAAITALAASAIAPMPFSFLGFLPRNNSDQKRLFELYKTINNTLIFYESKNRLISTLENAYEILGNRDFCIAREMTKTNEEFIYGSLNNLDGLDELLGEITVVLSPAKEKLQDSNEEIISLINEELKSEDHAKDIAKRIHAMTAGYTVKQIYNMVIEQKK